MPTTSGHTSAIRAKKVIGTTVKSRAGQKLGEVEDVVLDKQSNSIMFAVVGFGGVLGMGEKFSPVPWSTLDFDPEFDAFVVPMSKDELQKAPVDSITELTRNDGTSIRKQAYDFYKAQPYWH